MHAGSLTLHKAGIPPTDKPRSLFSLFSHYTWNESADPKCPTAVSRPFHCRDESIWCNNIQSYRDRKPAQWPYCHPVLHLTTKENRIFFKKKKELCFCKYFELTFLAENKSLLSINLWPSSLPLLVPITVLSFHFCAYSWDITAIAICEQNPHPVLSKAEHTCTHNYCSLSKVLALQKWHDHNSRHQEIRDCLVVSPWDGKYHQVSISFSEITFKLETPLKHPCSQAKMDILDLAHIPEELPTCSLWPFPGAGRGQQKQVGPADSGPIPAWMVRGLKSLTRQHNSSAAVFEHALSFCPNQGWNHGHSEHQSSPVCCNRLSFCNCLSDRSWLN